MISDDIFYAKLKDPSICPKGVIKEIRADTLRHAAVVVSRGADIEERLLAEADAYDPQPKDAA